MKKIILLLIIYNLFLFSPSKVLAQESEKYITIVNPVRISKYSKSPVDSLKNEYSVINKLELPATWLLTYDALNNKDGVEVIKEMDKFQEIGLFLEITPSFATDAGVEYHNSGSWHHANSVFLSGYTQQNELS